LTIGDFRLKGTLEEWAFQNRQSEIENQQ